MENLTEKTRRLNKNSDFWEGDNLNLSNGKFSFCRLYAVNPETRTCSIKTYGSDYAVADADHTGVQWLSPYSSPDGDEISFVPEENSLGLCVFMDGVPWVIGFFNPITLSPDSIIQDLERDGVDPAGGSAAQNKERINPGDFIFRTRGRCRFILRRGGEIEIEATKLCRRTYFPNENLINDLCQNYEFRSNGGTLDWVDVGNNKTLHAQEFRSDINRTHVIQQSRGTVEPGSLLIEKYEMGEGTIPDEENEGTIRAILSKKLFKDGRSLYQLNGFSLYKEVKSTGEHQFGVGGFNYYSDIKPTGEVIVNVANNFQWQVLPSGEMNLDIGISEGKENNIRPQGGEGNFKMNVKPSGEFNINVANTTNISVQSSGTTVINVGNGNSVIAIDPNGAVTLRGSSRLTVESPNINLSAGSVAIGSSPSDNLPLGGLLLAALNRIIAVFNTHTHPVPQSPGGVNPSQPPILRVQTLKADILSDSIKVQS